MGDLFSTPRQQGAVTEVTSNSILQNFWDLNEPGKLLFRAKPTQLPDVG